MCGNSQLCAPSALRLAMAGDNQLPDQYRGTYSEVTFWQKVGQCALKAGREAIGKALVLYYTLGEPATPAWAKTAITAALGYFIFPADAIADITPSIGFSDDLGVLLVALATVASSVTPEARKRAAERLDALFGGGAGGKTEESNPPD